VKYKLGDIVNIAMQHGGASLVEKMTNILNSQWNIIFLKKLNLISFLLSYTTLSVNIY
jgi:hypothetical protein